MTDKEISMSVEDTNALRAKLGLKPLNVDQPSDAAAPGTSKLQNDVLIAPSLPNEKQVTEQMRQKLQTQRERRQMTQKLSAVKGLGEADDDEDDDPMAWVKRSRELARRKEAEEQARKLAEMDEALEKEAEAAPKYDVNDIKGMRVDHDVATSLQDGSQMVFTLQDRGVLDDDDDNDVLENVNLVDDEKARERQEEVKKMGRTHAMDAIDDPLGLKTKSVLEKYDNIDAVTGDRSGSRLKAGSYVIGQQVSAAEPTEEDLVRERLKGTVSLESAVNYGQSDYYTTDEAARMKKRKRKKKSKPKKALTADDLLSMGQDDVEESTATATSGTAAAMDQDTPEHTVVDQDTLLDAAGDEEDEMESELQAALHKLRRAKQRSHQASRDVADLVRSNAELSAKHEPIETEQQGITLTSMTEFVQGLGDKPEASTRRAAAPKPEPEAAVPIKAEPASSAMDEAPDAPAPSRWTSAPSGSSTTGAAARSIKSEPAAPAAAEEEEEQLLDDEGNVGFSLADALKVAKRSGYLEGSAKAKKAKEAEGEGKVAKLRATNAQIDTRGERERGGGGRDDWRRGSSYGSSSHDPFAAKAASYKPSFNIEYKDEEGRQVDLKDAFRIMSHAFHGHGSGKNKLEKRRRRREEDMKMLQSATDDPALIESMRRKQEATGASHFVLSGTQT